MTSFARVAALVLCSLLLLGARDTEPGAPSIFLVAKPELQDPNFAYSVVLVLFPKEAGPIGVILNRPTRFTLKEAFPEEPQLKGRNDALYLGGPVQPNGLMFLFRGQTAADRAFPVIGDLYLSGDAELLSRLLARSSSAVHRYFLGYSGWTAAQLEHEIALGAWYVVEADMESIVQTDPKKLWQELVRRATAVKT